jgi:hypothetical protein
MKHYLVTVVPSVLIATMISMAAAPPDPLALKRNQWQRLLDEKRFRFSESDTGILHSLSQYDGDCKINIIYDPKTWPLELLTFRFDRDGKEIISLRGHTKSVFRTVDRILFFADFHPSSAGCSVAAYDMNSGKLLWKTNLDAIPFPPHSAYQNEVMIDFLNLPGQHGKGNLLITGHETLRDYYEVLDRRTGRQLAYKRFSKRPMNR